MSSEAEAAIKTLREAEAFHRLVGNAPSFVGVVTQLPALAASDQTLLITGETGTGKELIARAIHYLSSRANLPFVPVNCGSLPDSLVEDDLFGHERGAFTDARSRRPGLIEQAGKGTLFLDEVESLSLRAQVALLRVLQERSWRALGSVSEQRVDVRFLAATNAPLQEMVRCAAFRADLYYRLCVLWVQVPPLRERREDIPRLARYFLAKHARADYGNLVLSSGSELMLSSCDWPGNVRELENAIIRAIQFARGPQIEPEDFGPMLAPGEPSAGHQQPSFQALKRRLVRKFEHDYLTRLMLEHGGNITRAARAAGKERRELGKLLKKHSLQPHPISETGPGQGSARNPSAGLLPAETARATRDRNQDVCSEG